MHPARRARLPHGNRLRDLAYFETGPEFVAVLLRQREHARAHHQTNRAKLYDTLITTAEATPS